MNTPKVTDPTSMRLTRRDALKGAACGFGHLAFAALATSATRTAGAQSPSPSTRPSHFVPRARRVIFLCMRGGPSHVDTFDFKPRLLADSGKPGARPGSVWMAPKGEFAQHGRSGLWVSDLFPQLARHADSLCLLRSMKTEVPAHPQAFLRLHTGTTQFVRPSLGAWVFYGMGTANENLPGFVTITPPAGFGGAQNYGSAFLPAFFQGTRVGSDNRPVAGAEVKHLRPPMPGTAQRLELDFLQSLNREALRRDPQDAQVEGVIQSYELAFRMQSRMPSVMDLGQESAATQKLYGIGDRATEDFGRKCLLARRMVEAGVRFVEICHGNWDHHFNLTTSLRNSCAGVDRPMAGLLADLAARGMLEDTLVMWGGEFGRTPYAQGSDGRDHNHRGFTLWLAGGGVKGGHSHGATDEFGQEAVQDKVSIHDLHATLLHLLGFDHERLTYRHAGRDFRLTDVHGQVLRSIVA